MKKRSNSNEKIAETIFFATVGGISADVDVKKIIFFKDIMNQYESGLCINVNSINVNSSRNIAHNFIKSNKIKKILRKKFIDFGYEQIKFKDFFIHPVKISWECIDEIFQSDGIDDINSIIIKQGDFVVHKSLSKFEIFQELKERLIKNSSVETASVLMGIRKINFELIDLIHERMNGEFIRSDVVVRFIMNNSNCNAREICPSIPKIMDFFGYEKFINSDVQADGRFESNGKSVTLYHKKGSHIRIIPKFVLNRSFDESYKFFESGGI